MDAPSAREYVFEFYHDGLTRPLGTLLVSIGNSDILRSQRFTKNNR